MTTRTYRRYISLEAVKRDPVSVSSGTATQDTRLKDLIRKASHWIEEELDRWFYPVLATYYFDHPKDTTVLDIVPWLLSIDASGFTTDNGGTTLVEGTDFHLVQHIPAKHRNVYRAPYNRVVMDPSGDTTVLSWSDTPLKANAIAGAWSWSDDTEDTGTTLSAAISSTTATTFTAADGTAIETGWMLLIDTEQMFVVSVSTNTVTVKRGQGGTTAATHLTGIAISRYVPPDDIETLCGIIVARLWHRGGTKWTDGVGSPDAGILYFHALPAEARAIIDRYKEAEEGLSAVVRWDMLDR